MTDKLQSHLSHPNPDNLRERLIGSAPNARRPRKHLVYITSGKGGAGKTMSAFQVTDYFAEAGSVLGIETDPGNRHFLRGYMQESAPDAEDWFPKQQGIQIIEQRIRSEDNANRIDVTQFSTMMMTVVEAEEEFIVIDSAAGDTETVVRCGEILVETCRECDIHLTMAVVIDSLDPTAIDVIGKLHSTLEASDRTVLVKNTRTSLNFLHIEESPVVIRVMGLPNTKTMMLDKIGEYQLEMHRVKGWTWRDLTTSSPIMIRIEAKRLRREFHQAWGKALQP